MYQLFFTKSASKHLDTIDKRYHQALLKALERLRHNPQIGQPLTGQFKHLWRLRFSRYRIIYQIKNRQLLIIIISILHRREVYK